MKSIAIATKQTEARRAKREKVRLSARGDFANGAFVVDCVVTELSVEGARLQLPFPIISLRTLELAIPARNLKCRARVAWRRNTTMGIMFEPATDLIK
jgi:hypothetical protein